VPRLYLATPEVDDPSPLVASLPGLLAAADVAAGQRAFAHRARMNALASKGEWETGLEKKVA